MKFHSSLKKGVFILFLIGGTHLVANEMSSATGTIIINKKGIPIHEGILLLRKPKNTYADSKIYTIEIVLKNSTKKSVCHLTANLPKRLKLKKRTILTVEYNQVGLTCIDSGQVFTIAPSVTTMKDTTYNAYFNKRKKTSKKKFIQIKETYFEGAFLRLILRPIKGNIDQMSLSVQGITPQRDIVRIKKAHLPIYKEK